jgi:hypothetical protein
MMEHVTGSRAPVPAVGGAAGYRIPPDAEEQAVLERRFAVLDIDGNGVWQWDDYQRLTRRLCEAFGHAADSAAGQAVAAGQHSLFDALLPYMDADGDQEITQDEFIAAVGRTVSDRAGFAAAVRTPAPSSKWLTRTVTERWTPGSTPGWPRCTVPQRRRPHRPSAGLTGTATACWTPRS